jgi:hypothetical protein
MLLWVTAFVAFFVIGAASVMFALLSEAPREVAHAIVLPPGYAYVVGEDRYRMPVEKAFFASWHGGWHGDGEDVTAYKLAPGQSMAVVAALKAEHADYQWEEPLAGHALIGHMWHLFPSGFRPDTKARLVHGVTTTGPLMRAYYIDAARDVLFVVSIQH